MIETKDQDRTVEGEVIYRITSPKFKAEMCQDLISMGLHGKSIQLFCVKHGISNSTRVKWEKKFPMFKEAVEQHKMALQAYWMEKAANAALDRSAVGSEKIMLKMLDISFQEDKVKEELMKELVTGIMSAEDRQTRLEHLRQKLLESAGGLKNDNEPKSE